MKHCTIGQCTRYPTMGDQCVTHWYEIQGMPMPELVPLTPGGWVDTWRHGHALKRAAIAQVGEAADPVFKAAAIKAIRALCKQQNEMTADDVWMALERSGASQTHEPRALGAVMQYAARLGLIRSTGRWQESVLPQRHARPVRVWSCQ